jgi:hypothetical protein
MGRTSIEHFAVAAANFSIGLVWPERVGIVGLERSSVDDALCRSSREEG